MNRTGAEAELLELAHAEPTYDYLICGMRVRSSIRLTIPAAPFAGDSEIEMLPGESGVFNNVRHQVHLNPSHWFHDHELSSGWSYIRCDKWFEFLVSPNGAQILYRILGSVSMESLQTYLLGRVLSHALVKRGQEPLHASAVVVDGLAIAFLGSSTFGKSSLAACFVGAGFAFLTDDVLRLEEARGQLMAHPGPPRIKLFPKLARRFLGDASKGVPINPITEKLVFPVSGTQASQVSVPLAAIFVVTAARDVHRRQRISVHRTPPRDALFSLLCFSHNHCLAGSARLARQFAAAKLVVDKAPVWTLAYPRVLDSLSLVRDAILANRRRSSTC